MDCFRFCGATCREKRLIIVTKFVILKKKQSYYHKGKVWIQHMDQIQNFRYVVKK